ncbi:protein kinase [Streptomyces sp. NPDC046759]|uniref:serine/threonine-protein kinase n=1 Tax=Streptomyces sp. NPDC046759 TaxID=3155019 RepID=UPI003401ED33
MGEVFAGRYELADPIGRGGVGAVWRAWDHRRRRYVAAKVLQQRDAHSLLRFVREQALRIDHPHVLAPASWAADDDKVLFTMDLVAGGSLVHLVGDYGPLPPAFVCALLDQLLSGLAAVHAEGVIHRDIKPANVLLEATGTGRPRLRLSDFGIAMRLGEPRLTETNLVVGTPGYLAPEQMLGAEPDFPADLFAVGLVALYLLEGAKPDAKALVQHFAENGTPGPPKGIPEPLWQVVAGLLQPDPAARFRTATGARKALASAAELLAEPEPDDELIEVFDQLGPLPPGFGPDGPLQRATKVASELVQGADVQGADVQGTEGSPVTHTGAGTDPDAGTGADAAGGSPGHSAAGARTGSAARGDSPSGTGSCSLSDTGSFRLPPPPEPSTYVQRPQDSGSYAPPASQRAGVQGRYDERQAHQGADPSSHPTPVHPPQHPPRLPLHAPYVSPPAESGRDPQVPQAPHAPHAPYVPQVPQVPQALWSPVPSPSAMEGHRVDAPTASYTAQDHRLPGPAQPVAGAPAQGRRAHRASGARRANRARRPGPPARVAIPILLLALACYAVGFWALTRV